MRRIADREGRRIAEVEERHTAVVEVVHSQLAAEEPRIGQAAAADTGLAVQANRTGLVVVRHSLVARLEEVLPILPAEVEGLHKVVDSLAGEADSFLAVVGHPNPAVEAARYIHTGAGAADPILPG